MEGGLRLVVDAEGKEVEVLNFQTPPLTSTPPRLLDKRNGVLVVRGHTHREREVYAGSV